MKLEVLMSAMNQTSFKLVEQANIKTDAIIINQTNQHSYLETEHDGNLIRMYNYNERGIGKSRNKALMLSDADICLIADDDVKYIDNYEELILNEFKENEDADLIIFDLFILEQDGYRSYRNKNKKLNQLNFMKHGGPKIAFRREKLLKKNIFFSLLFGGGAKYGSGEDTLFLKECLSSGLKVYETETNIGEIDNRESTWFTGYTKKYFYDKGALYKALHPHIWFLMCVQHLVRHHRNEKNMLGILKAMVRGAREF